MGGITITESAPERIVTGTYSGVRFFVIGVKQNEGSAEAVARASQDLIDIGLAEGATALIVDIPNATVRAAYVTEV